MSAEKAMKLTQGQAVNVERAKGREVGVPIQY